METFRRMSGFRLYGRYLRIHFRSGLQYKGWPFLILQTLLVSVTDLIGTIFLFSRFGSIGEWSAERILLVYAITITSFGLAETFCRGFDYFPWKMVRTGDFDRLLLRPRPLALQASISFFHLHRLARVFAGMSVILWSLLRQGIPMTPSRILLLAGALAGGFLTYTGVFVLTSGLAFFTVKGLDWIYIFTNAGGEVTRCPVEHLPRILYAVFTFLIPILVISYYPCSALCGWGEPLWKGLLALPAGAAFLGISLLVWRFGVRHYKSSGG